MSTTENLLLMEAFSASEIMALWRGESPVRTTGEFVRFCSTHAGSSYRASSTNKEYDCVKQTRRHAQEPLTYPASDRGHITVVVSLEKLFLKPAYFHIRGL